ncbi:unnamed protein product [Ascophyllum nodosum]
MHILCAGINPNFVQQPDCTFNKFCTMIRDVTKDYNERDDDCRKSGSHDESWSFCGIRLDVA